MYINNFVFSVGLKREKSKHLVHKEIFTFSDYLFSSFYTSFYLLDIF